MSDSPVMAFFNKAADLILLNFIVLVCSLPVVTIGASLTAMYHVCLLSIRQGDGYVVKRFFTEFRRSFGKATLVWICVLILGTISVINELFWMRMGTTFGKVMFCVSAIVILAIAMVVTWIFPVLGKFEDKLGRSIRNAAAFAFGYLPYTLVVIALAVIFGYANLKSIAANMVTLLVGVGLLGYVQSFFYYKVFMNHIDEKFDDFEHEIPDQTDGEQ